MNAMLEKPKYINENGETFYGRKQVVIDMPRFAADLAKELGGKVRPGAERPLEFQTIAIGENVLEVHFDSWKRRVTASLIAPDVAHGDWSSYAKDQKAESASVNPDGRPIASIAKDIKKRVIDANLPAMAARRAYAEQQKQNRADIVAKAKALGAACKSLDVKVNEREQVAAIWSRSSVYLDARMGPTGRVDIQRIGGISSETFIKIVKLLEAKEAKTS